MIRINEQFSSVQGEGFWTGTPCHFIRLQGCTLRCSFCDSKSTWDLNGGILMTFQEIVNWIPSNIKRVIITGGEPTLHRNLPDLVGFLDKLGYDVHIETSGNHYEVLKEVMYTFPGVWITISPKQLIPTSDVLLLADEIKWIIQMERDLWAMDEVWEELTKLKQDSPLFYLQPVSCEREATDLCIRHILAYAGRDYRLSIQIHKYIGVK